MLKGKIIKRISVLILCILIIQIIKIYPAQKVTNTTLSVNKGVIYLLDNSKFLSRLEITYDSLTKEDNIKEIIDILTINTKKSKIRAGFYPIIPENTKLLDVKVNGTNVLLNFSKEFLDISENLEEKLIEAIVFSITSLDQINSVTIKVEGVLLQKLPHSLKKIPENLDRSFKINKVYEINTINDIVSTTIYYPAKYDDYKYYIPVTKYTNSQKEKIEIIISELESSNTYSSNIINYMNSETKLINYELLDTSLLLNFNEAIFGDLVDKNITEEVLYALNYSIKENYDNVQSVMYLINDNPFETYFFPRGWACR